VAPTRQPASESLRRAFGVIDVSTVGGTAVVLVDGAPRGTAPMRLELAPGVHRIEVMSPGAAYNPRRRDIPVADRDTVRLEFMRVPVRRCGSSCSHPVTVRRSSGASTLNASLSPWLAS
jgi:hypothetical protein